MAALDPRHLVDDGPGRLATPTRCGAALVVMVGAPGTGKSYLARQVAAALDADLIQTDAVRKEMFPRPRYSATESRAVYDESFRRLRVVLKDGCRVVFDATNLRERRRSALYALGEGLGATVTVVRAYAPDAVIRARVVQRFRDRDPLDQSDATWQISRRLQRQSQPILYPHLVVNTLVSPRPAIRVLRQLMEACPPSTRLGTLDRVTRFGYAHGRVDAETRPDDGCAEDHRRV